MLKIKEWDDEWIMTFWQSNCIPNFKLKKKKKKKTKQNKKKKKKKNIFTWAIQLNYNKLIFYSKTQNNQYEWWIQIKFEKWAKKLILNAFHAGQIMNND